MDAMAYTRDLVLDSVMRIYNMDQQDAEVYFRDLWLISFSFARYALDTIDAIRRVTAKGVKHIAFTDTPLSPAARHADRYFIISNTSFHNTPSLSGAIAFIDAILAETAQRNPDQARTNMKEVEEFFGGRDMYSAGR